MNETTVTFTGWLGSDVTMRQAGGVPVASFRVATAPRRFSRRSEEWVDGETQWYTVQAWRGLAENAALSLRRGDPVLVHGRLSVRTWTTNAGVETTTLEVDALHLGHDLTRGRSAFSRAPRPERVEAAAPESGSAPGETATGEVSEPEQRAGVA
ncbi:single-stranded DNA-binding protein [Nocardioides fonticola]|uniref:Single-stranded DNA-binding protein n=1 Tax=Nocardioides fonticola TaxID=450363 RepID=A0ABP7XIZ7_9ACTN